MTGTGRKTSAMERFSSGPEIGLSSEESQWEEKVNQIRVYSGEKYETLGEAEAGTVCAVTGLTKTWAGEGLGFEKEALLPELSPSFCHSVLLPRGCDPAVMLPRLKQLEEEDPQLHILWDEHSKEIKVQIMGQVQIEILKNLIEERFGVLVEFGEGTIVYKETIADTVEGIGHFEPLRHYAEVHLLMEPGERGSGLQFEANCSEDILDRNWQRLILTHLKEKRHKGILTGSELTDIKITLITGRAHQKHTEGGDFRQATYRAVRQGLMEGHCRLLEPYYEFRLEIPSEYTGRAMADIDRMQGCFEAPVQDGEMTIIYGNAPVSTMRSYPMEVISYTRGRGRFSCSPSGYKPCHNEEEIITAFGYDSEADVDNPSSSIFCSHGAGYQVPWYQVKEQMHVESPLALSTRRGQEIHLTETIPKPEGNFYVDDKELEEIFVRTYGTSKREKYQEQPRKLNFEHLSPVKSQKPQEPIQEYLLVDGYNIIFFLEELRELAKSTIDGARHKLMDILCNYQGYKKCILILVFDAYKVEGGLGQAIQYHNIHVVYTKEAETADQYIEKLAYEMGRNHQVTVATSDGLEQLIIRGEGCHLLSAQDLKEEIEYVNLQIEAEHLKPLREGEGKGKNYLFGHAQEDVAEYLEDVRLGKKTKKEK